MTKMKKLIALICSLAIALALPMSALAVENGSSSEQETVVAQGSNSTLTVIGTQEQLHGFDACDLVVVPTATLASNTPAGVQILNSYEIYYNDRKHDAIIGGGTVVVNLGCQYDNYYYTCYVEHTDHSTEEVHGTTDASGNAAFYVSKLSFYTFVINGKVPTSTDSGATSPKTGMDYTVAAGVAGIAPIGAGIAFAARRKMSE